MGLPLFVAPVESDVKSKSPNKNASSHAPRTHRIFRNRRPDGYETRAMRRRAAILQGSLDGPGAGEYPTTRFNPASWEEYPYPPPADAPARYPWIESGQPPPPEAYTLPTGSSSAAPRSGRTAGGFAMLRGNGRSSIHHGRLMSLLGDSYALRIDSTSPPPPGELIRLANAADSPEAFERGTYQRDRIAPSVAARFDRSPDRSRPRRTRSGLAPLQRESTRRALEGDRRQDSQPGTNRPGGLDGLGDRNRSLSPEVWDTLLTTLTPDPQPPSIGSSFASTSAPASGATSQNQSAAASSHTSLTGLDLAAAGDYGVEQPCDSSHEDSDSDYEPTDDETVRPDRLSMNFPSRDRRFVSALDTNDHSNTSYVRHRADHAASRPTLHFPGRPVHRSSLRGLTHAHPPGDSRGASSGVTRESSAEPRGSAGQRDSGLSFSASESNSQSMDDVAWAGMQRIMRNLAEREDIPDEWWAEAGLSRAIPGDS